MQEAKPHSRSNQSNKFNASTCLFILTTVLLASMLVSFGRLGWPGLHWDAALYGTPVINVADGKGWIFGSYTPLIIARPNLTYNIHGLLHVIIYGVLLKATGWSRYLQVMAFVNATTFAIYTGIAAVLLSRSDAVRIRAFITALLVGLFAGVICLGLQGRPEQLAPLLLVPPLLTTVAAARLRTLALVLGICLGLLTLLSPLVGMVFSVIATALLYVRAGDKIRVFLRSMGLLSLVAVATLTLLTLTLTPFTPLDWAKTILTAGGSTYNLNGVFVRPLFWGGGTLVVPGWNFTALFFTIMGLGVIWRRGYLGWLAVPLFAAAWFVLNRKMADYSYAPFLPFALCLALAAGQQFRIPGLTQAGSRRCLRVLTVGLGSIYSVVFLWYVLVSASTPSEQLSLNQAREVFQASTAGRELQRADIAVGFPALRWPSMVVLGDADDRFLAVNARSEPTDNDEVSSYERKTGRPVRYFVLSQTKTGRNPCPPEQIYLGRVEFRLLESHWLCPSPQPLDHLAGSTHLTNRYAFAIYRRAPTPSGSPNRSGQRQ